MGGGSPGGGRAAKSGLAIKESGFRGDQSSKPDRFKLKTPSEPSTTSAVGPVFKCVLNLPAPGINTKLARINATTALFYFKIRTYYSRFIQFLLFSGVKFNVYVPT